MKRVIAPPCFGVAAASRRSVACLAILALLAASAGRAQADDESLESVVDLARLTVISARLMVQAKTIQAIERYGFVKDAHCVFGASLASKETAWMRMTLKKDTELLWFGAGDDNCQDLDIEVEDPDGAILAKDVAGDAIPFVKFRVKQNGEHRLKLTLFKGTGTSFCAIVMMEQNGWNIPLDNLGTALGEFVRIAGRAAILMDRMSHGRLAVRLPEGGTGWCLFGTVMKQGEQRSILNLGFGQGPRVFVSAGCNQATDIDLEVTDQTTKETIAADKQPDATPVCLAATDANTLYTVCASLPRSRGAALTLTGIFRVEESKTVQPRIQPAMGL